MNRCPRTWFSTELHTGKRLLRTRLSDLLTAPKRRGTAPLVLALFLTLTAGSLAACTAAAQPPELDLAGLLIRYPQEEAWTDLASLIPAPAAWAEQELGGRNTIRSLDHDLLSRDPGIQGGFVDAQNGWLTFSSSRALGPISDTCVYRTHDGGHTWEEAGALEGDGALWSSVHCAAFLDDDHAVLCTGLFLDAPVFYTVDGGVTWERARLPYPDLAADTLFEEDGRLVMTAHRYGSDASGTLTLVSEDSGAVWTETTSF